MTEHSTSPEKRQAGAPAADSRTRNRPDTGHARKPQGAIPDPRGALRRPPAEEQPAPDRAGLPAAAESRNPHSEHSTPEGEQVWDSERDAADAAHRSAAHGDRTDHPGEPASAGQARTGGTASEHPDQPGATDREAAIRGLGGRDTGVPRPGGTDREAAARAAGQGHGEMTDDIRPADTADEAARTDGRTGGHSGGPLDDQAARIPHPVGPAGASGAPGEETRAVPPTGAGGAPETAAARDRGGDRLRFVGAATRRIARGIDLDEIVLGLCRATVPTFADAILVYLRDPLPVGDERPVGPVVLRLRRTDRIPEEPDTDGVRLPLMPAQPDLSPLMVGGPANELCEVEPGSPLAEVLRGVRPVFGDSPAARAALPELLGDGRSVAPGQRTVLAPLRGRRRVIGAAVFVRRPDRPAFEPDDLLVAAQLATHTALGVDKAVLYGREVYIADELQRTMLPDSLPQPTGVRLASRYLPAAETARVGGDWYDAIPLPGNRVALVVGDVMGHSMTSAAIMGQLRTTAQTLAGLDLPPQEVLHHLDEQAQRLGTDRMATCLYAVYDPVAHRIVVANAGHPPPVLLHRGGRAEVLRVPPGAPIGVGGVDFEAVELDAPAGATLLLYTDGLVESRMRDVWTGIEQLRERLNATARLTAPNPPPLEPLCDEVLDMLGPGDRDDDVALLAARFEGIAPSDVAYWFLDPKAQTAGQARRLARRALDRWGLGELTDAVELLVSEVVTNAVRYAERPITLRLLRTDVLRCEVGDDVPQLPRLRQARPSDEGGRGLYLVNRLARRWGATRLSAGKVVWFELAFPS
ncbi:serine/threonine protein phosphatase [Streptomyces albus subsp. albus]|nr:serine/threonine protein phosphatase [Streptomyces albus subsp. albus]